MSDYKLISALLPIYSFEKTLLCQNEQI